MTRNDLTRAMQLGRQTPPNVNAPPVIYREGGYIVAAPSGGIPGRSGSTPGKATCTVWRIGGDSLIAEEGVDEQDVYNLSTEAVPEGDYKVADRAGGFLVVEGFTPRLTDKEICEAMCRACPPYSSDPASPCGDDVPDCEPYFQCEDQASGTAIAWELGADSQGTYPAGTWAVGSASCDTNPVDCCRITQAVWDGAFQNIIGSYTIQFAYDGSGDYVATMSLDSATYVSVNNGTVGSNEDRTFSIPYTDNGFTGQINFNGGLCNVVGAGLGTDFFAAHPELLRDGCMCSDARRLMNSWTREKALSRIRALSRMVAGTDGSITPATARILLEDFLTP